MILEQVCEMEEICLKYIITITKTNEIRM